MVHLTGFFGMLPLFKSKNIFVDKEITMELDVISQENEHLENFKDDMPTDLNEMSTPVPPYIDNFMEKMMVKGEQNSALNKSQIIEKSIKSIAFSDKTLNILKDTFLNKELRGNPAYMDYYQTIREKVRKNAYRYYNSKERGEIFLSFIVLSDGKLKDVHLRRESGISNDLINNALRSVRESSPFPVFPQELKDYPSLQFNLSIHFKNN